MAGAAGPNEHAVSCSRACAVLSFAQLRLVTIAESHLVTHILASFSFENNSRLPASGTW
jgi:hypothetical protein